MNIIEALNKLRGFSPAEKIQHFQGETWDIDNLLDCLSVEGNEGFLEDSSDGGEWTANARGVYKLDEEGYLTGDCYRVIE